MRSARSTDQGYLAKVGKTQNSWTVADSDGIDGFHVHQTRHTFAWRWRERDGIIVVLHQVLGHVSIETTQRYARLSDEAVMREASRIGGAN